MSIISKRWSFSLGFAVVCWVPCVILMQGGPRVSTFVAYVHFLPAQLWLCMSGFGGLWSYYLMVFAQWFVIGLLVSVLLGKRKGVTNAD